MMNQEREQPEKADSKRESLDPSYAENLRRTSSAAAVVGGISAERREAAGKAWMKKLRAGDYAGPTLNRSRYL